MTWTFKLKEVLIVCKHAPIFYLKSLYMSRGFIFYCLYTSSRQDKPTIKEESASFFKY